MHHARATRFLFVLLSFVLLGHTARAATNSTATWSATPTDGNYITATNWSGGDYPNGTASRAVFGASNITTVSISSRLISTTLEFTSSATTPYTLNFANTGSGSSAHAIAGIVNDSAWSPTLIFQDGADLTLNSGGSLDDATLIFTSSSLFNFRGRGGTSSLYLNSGSTLAYYRGSDGESARLILNGMLTYGSSSDIITYTFGSLEGSGTIDLSSNSLAVGSNNRDATFSGTITGSESTATITKAGTGTWTLTATNSSLASFNVTGGTLAIDSDARLGTTGTLTLDGGTLQATASFSGLRGIILGAGGGTLDTQSYTVTQSGALSGSGAFTKTGTGTLTLSTAGTNTGGVTLSAGTLALGDDAALGTGTLSLNGGTLAASGGARTLANSVTLSGDTTLGGSNALTFNGAWTLAANRTLTVNNSALTTIAGAIGESGGARALLKSGSGTLELTGASTYTGGTLIAAGTVKINNATGSAFGTGAVTVAAGATLAGSGSFTGALQLNGTLAPGNSPGTLAAGDTTFAGGGSFQFQLNDATGAAGTSWDLLSVSGTLTLAATSTDPFTLDLTSLTLADIAGDAANFSATSDYSFTFLTTTGGVSGFSSDAFTIDTSHFSNPFTGTWSVSLTNSGRDLTLNYASAVPEPSTYATFAGLAALAGAIVRRRCRKESARRRV